MSAGNDPWAEPERVVDVVRISIEITGEDAGDPELVLGLISKQICDGFTSGFFGDEGSSYRYSVEETVEP